MKISNSEGRFQTGDHRHIEVPQIGQGYKVCKEGQKYKSQQFKRKILISTCVVGSAVQWSG